MAKKLFQKGNKFGVGHGRPMLNEELVAACRSHAPEIVSTLSKILKDGKKNEKVRAAEVLLERGYGKAIQPTKELQANESYSDFLDKVMDKK